MYLLFKYPPYHKQTIIMRDQPPNSRDIIMSWFKNQQKIMHPSCILNSACVLLQQPNYMWYRNTVGLLGDYYFIVLAINNTGYDFLGEWVKWLI